MESARNLHVGRVTMEAAQRILFVDTETTGLRAPSSTAADADRVISLGFFEVDAVAMRQGLCRGRYGYFLFNPQRRSSADARRVHGYSDRILAGQETFASLAATLYPAFASADTIVAHNAAFDRPFIDSEFALAGQPLPQKPWACTMTAERARGVGSASLDAAVERLGIRRDSDRHGALEDAWLAMMLYLAQNGIRLPGQQYRPQCNPMNLRVVSENTAAN